MTTPKYWVLPLGGYPDTKADYSPADTLEGCKTIADGGIWRPRGAHIFDGKREPWNERDPYPDRYVDERLRIHRA